MPNQKSMATVTRPWVDTSNSEQGHHRAFSAVSYDSDYDRDSEQPPVPTGRESYLPLNPRPRSATSPTLTTSFLEPLNTGAKESYVPAKRSSLGTTIVNSNAGPLSSRHRGLKGPPGGGGGGGGPRGPGGPGGPAGGGPPVIPYDTKSLSFWLIMLSCFMAIFLVAIDRTILATAIPTITDEFNSQDDIGWYAAAYMLTGAASQLFFGRVYKFYHLKWTFLLCIGIFEAGSVVCAVATESHFFIVGRAVSGLGSAGIFTGSMMIMIPMVPMPKRPLFQSMFGMIFGISSVAGPLLGGVFTSKLTWRWCFWINLPMGAITVAVVMFLLKVPPTPTKKKVPIKDQVLRLDPLGTFFIVPSVASLLLAMQWGGTRYGWGSWRIILLFSVFGVSFAAFCAVQGFMPKTATVPWRIISQRSIFFAAMFNFFLTSAQLVIIYFIPIWFQSVQGATPIDSGVQTIPFVLSIVVSSIMAGILTTKIGYYIPSMILSPVITIVGAGLLSSLAENSPSSHWIGYQFLAGFGVGLGVQVSNLCAQTVLPKEDVSVGVSIMFFTQGLGGAVGTSLGQTLLITALVSRLTGIAGLTAERILDSGATEILRLVQANAPDESNIVVSAYNFAVTRIFFIAMIMSFVTLSATFGMEWLSVKKQGGGPPGGPPDAGGPGGPPREHRSPGTREMMQTKHTDPEMGLPQHQKHHQKKNQQQQKQQQQKLPLIQGRAVSVPWGSTSTVAVGHNAHADDYQFFLTRKPLPPPEQPFGLEDERQRPQSAPSSDARKRPSRPHSVNGKLRKKSIMVEQFQQE